MFVHHAQHAAVRDLVADGAIGEPSAFIEAAVQAGFPANDDFNGADQDGFGYFQLTQRDGGRATGVVGGRLDEQVTIRAEREVILSGGAYNSPQLLMLSGIGPAPLLGALGLPVVVDAPKVGQNLQDHALVPLIFTHEHPISLLAAAAPENVERFMTERAGPLTSGPSMLTPASRGSVSLASDDPTAKSKIVHNYFAEESDLDTAVAALRIGLDIARQKALSPYTGTPSCRPPRTPTRTRATTRAGTRTRSSTRPPPVPWGRSSTRSCGCSASRRCAWWTPR
jgi:choline dehydrogenase-like flavoprotein